MTLLITTVFTPVCLEKLATIASYNSNTDRKRIFVRHFMNVCITLDETR